MSKEGHEIAKNSWIEDFLFGNDLTDKIKDSKAHTKDPYEKQTVVFTTQTL